MPVNWDALLEDDDVWRAKMSKKKGEKAVQDDGEDTIWRNEAADSLAELYYETYRIQKRRGGSQRLDLRPGSDFQRYISSHIKPLGKYGLWEALFPCPAAARSAQAIDEALLLLADTKLVDRVYSGDIVTAKKLILNIEKKRAKYLEM